MNKTVLVTGGARGIGRAISELFAENDYNVIINYLTSENEAFSMEQTFKQKGYSVMIYKADVTDREQVKSMINKGVAEFGKIDVLVNNAGISQQKLFTEIREDEWDRMMNVHVKGTYNCCQCVLPDMIRRKQGKIINISSIWGMTGASCEVHYSTAKAAVIGLTKSLAKELGPSNIQVNCVAPGVIDTEMNKFLNSSEMNELINDTPLLRVGRADEAAHAVFYLASEHADFITGQVLSPNGGYLI